jgi:RNA recognition motif-containing protein
MQHKVDWNAPPREGCVIYIGHIPHGFYEEQMRGFFSQFGIVTRVRLSRSKKVGVVPHPIRCTLQRVRGSLTPASWGHWAGANTPVE